MRLPYHWRMRRVLRVVAAALATATVLAAPAVAGAARKVDCSARASPGVDFHDCNLSHRQFAHANLTGANLTGANLTGTGLFNSVLFGADLTGANLTDANLATANLTEAKLNRATIKGATIVQADFAETSLDHVASGDLHGRPQSLPARFFTKRGVLFGPGVNLAGQWLAGLDLAHANLSRSILTGADLERANLSHTSLSGTKMLGAILTGARINDTGFHDAMLFKPNRRGVRTGGMVRHPRELPAGFLLADGYFIGPGANLHHAQLVGLDLAKVNFTAADLDEANLARTVLWGAEFSITSMQRTGFSHASLRGANLSNLSIASDNLTGADFTDVRILGRPLRELPPGWVNVKGHLVGPGANLSGADLSFSRFLRADLDGANLRGTNLSGSYLSRARLVGCITGRLVIRGTPPVLPAHWKLFRGVLLGPGSVLLGARLQNAQLDRIVLASADLVHVNFQNTDLAHANLSHAVLDGVNLQHANLSHASLGGVTSTKLVGHPAGLPPGWAIVGGSLVKRR